MAAAKADLTHGWVIVAERATASGLVQVTVGLRDGRRLQVSMPRSQTTLAGRHEAITAAIRGLRPPPPPQPPLEGV